MNNVGVKGVTKKALYVQTSNTRQVKETKIIS